MMFETACAFGPSYNGGFLSNAVGFGAEAPAEAAEAIADHARDAMLGHYDPAEELARVGALGDGPWGDTATAVVAAPGARVQLDEEHSMPTPMPAIAGAELRAHRVEAVVQEGGIVAIMGLPFRAGERVEVIVLNRAVSVVNGAESVAAEMWQGLRGSVIHYDDPTEPVGVEDWEALK